MNEPAVADLVWLPDGTPFSPRYGDVYHSRAGREQAQRVFLEGNGLPERWHDSPRFTILETGFGLGVNFLTTWRAWEAAGRPCELSYVGLELHPLAPAEFAEAHAHLGRADEFSERLVMAWTSGAPSSGCVDLAPNAPSLELEFGDALRLLRARSEPVDAFFLDGFSPATNPAMWSNELFAELARLSRPETTLATYTVAGDVRRGLAAVGFALEQRPGFASKKSMLVGRCSR